MLKLGFFLSFTLFLSLCRGSLGQVVQPSRRTSTLSDTAAATSTGGGVGRRRSIITSESQDDAWTGDEMSTAPRPSTSSAHPITFQVMWFLGITTLFKGNYSDRPFLQEIPGIGDFTGN